MRVWAADDPKCLAIFAGRITFWQQRLKAGERRLLELVIDAGSRGISLEQLAEAAQMAKSGGTFSTYVGTLKRNRLAAMHDGQLRIHPWLEGRM